MSFHSFIEALISSTSFQIGVGNILLALNSKHENQVVTSLMYRAGKLPVIYLQISDN